MISDISILSWNIGELKGIKTQNCVKIDELLKQYRYKGLFDSKVIVFGFQEVVSSEYNHLIEYLNNKMEQEDFVNSTLPVCACCTTDLEKEIYLTQRISKDFQILTLFYIKKDYEGNINVQHLDSECQDKKIILGLVKVMTKGFTHSIITIDKNSYHIINGHLPFTKLEESKNYINLIKNSIQQSIKSEKTKSQHSFIFGDLNSRCLLTKECYKKNVTICPDLNDINYCNLLTELEEYDRIKAPMIDTVEKVNIQMNALLGGSHIHDDPTGITEPSDQSTTTSELKTYQYNLSCDLDNIDKDCIQKYLNTKDKLINLLLKRDSLRCCLGTDDWYEGRITFLPTYKRDKKNNSVFKFYKDYTLYKNGRLPGYADRIIFNFNKDIICNEYSSLRVEGNDHLPIIGRYFLNISQKNKSIQQDQNIQKINDYNLNFSACNEDTKDICKGQQGGRSSLKKKKISRIKKTIRENKKKKIKKTNKQIKKIKSIS